MKEGARPHTPGVIFDLDGTLADTLDDISNSMNQLFAGAGIPVVSRERSRSLIGQGLSNLLRHASGIDDVDRIAALVEDYREIYRGRLLEQTKLYPGVADLLDRLTNMRIPLAVLSNKPEEFTAPICEALLSRWPFVECRGAPNETQRKPDPTLALQIAAKMQRRPADLFFVGDSATDIKTAQNAGMISVAVTWGFRDRDHLGEAKPKYMIDEPGALIAFLGGSARCR